MSTLWKRANPVQLRMLVIIAGAVIDVRNHHPGRMPGRSFARSVAKRAVGTLWAQAHTLAGAEMRPSDRDRPHTGKADRRGAEISELRTGAQGTLPRSTARLRRRLRRRAVFHDRPAIVREFIRRLSKEIKPAKMAGRGEYAAGMIRALKLLAEIMRDETAEA